MLKSLLIQNFQAFAKREIEFDPRITMIVGPTDRGKSTMVRALRWVCLNKAPRGRYLHNGKSRCRVQLKVGQHVLTRLKNTGHTYLLDGKKYAAVGKNRPEAIARLLNLGEINFQRQHDAPFWFTLSAGQVSKELNQIVNLDVIDKSLSQIASEVRRAKVEVEVTEHRLSEARYKKKDLEWIKKAYAEYRGIERLKAAADKLASEAADLARLASEAASLQERAQNAKSAALDGLPAVSAGRKAFEIAARVGRLSELIEHIQQQRELQCRLQQRTS